MKKYTKICLVVLFLAGGAFTSTANARCPAGDMGCTSDNYKQKIKDRIQQGKQDVRDAKGIRQRVKAVGDTVKDCTDCATKVLTDSVGATK